MRSIIDAIRRLLGIFGLQIRRLPKKPSSRLPKRHPYDYLLEIPRHSPTTVTLLGKPFEIADARSFYYSYKELFERGVYAFTAPTSEPLIIDCGANYGTSITFFKQRYPSARVIGFEADPFIFSFLKKNIVSQELEGVEVHNLALWDTETKLSFYSERADAGRINELAEAPDHSVEVETTRLSSFIGKQVVDMLKIDIEGAEFPVLKEVQGLLGQVRNIFIEYHSFEKEPQVLGDLLNILTQSGFRYQLHTQFSPQKPLIERRSHVGMDLQLNVFGYRA